MMLPSLAWACPACYWADPKGLAAYWGTTLLLSLLPLAIGVSIGWPISRLIRRGKLHA